MNPVSPSLSVAGTATSRAWSRPGLALCIAAGGYVIAAVGLFLFGRFSLGLAVAPGWVSSLLVLGIVCMPLTAAIVLAGRSASIVGTARATGIRFWSITDLALGLGVGLLLRALAELIAPTTGTLESPLSGADAAAARIALVVSIVAVVAVSPLVEELFFRGVVLRASIVALAGAGRATAAVIAVVVSTGLFVALHTAAAGGVSTATMVATTAVGIGCGVVTVATGRIAAALVAHALFNTVGVVLLMW